MTESNQSCQWWQIWPKLFDGSDQKKLSHLANDKKRDRNFQVMLMITNNAKNCAVLPRWPTSDKTYALSAHWRTESDDIKPSQGGFQIMILWNNSNLQAGRNSCHWHWTVTVFSLFKESPTKMLSVRPRAEYNKDIIFSTNKTVQKASFHGVWQKPWCVCVPLTGRQFEKHAVT
jgi:hypothetical protein